MITKSHFSLLFTVLTFMCISAKAQSEEEAVKNTINQLFEGMHKRDTSLIRSVFSSDAIMQTVVRNKEGKVQIHNMAVDTFILFVGEPSDYTVDEKISFSTVLIDGDLAMAWTPYRLYVNDQFQHCGVNSFQLVRLDGKWKIQFIIDTRRRTNCN